MASADKKPSDKKIMFSSGRGGSGNIRRVKSTKEMTSRPLASPKMIELEPPRNRAAYGGRGGSGNIWTHVIEEGVFERVINHEISCARVLKEERDYEEAERRKSGVITRVRSKSDSKSISDSRSLASAPSRKSWASTSEVCILPSSAEPRKSFASSLLAPLRRNTLRSSDAQPCSDLAQSGSDSGHSAPSSDQASPSGLTTHLAPSTPSLSPSTSSPPPLPSPVKRWTTSGQRHFAADLARTRHLSNPLPPPTHPIPPLPHVRFAPPPSPSLPVPIPILTTPTDDRGPLTPIDDSYGLLDAAAVAASKARPIRRRPSTLAPPQLTPPPSLTLPELPGAPWHRVAAHPSRRRGALMYTLSQSAQSTGAIPSTTESNTRTERPRPRVATAMAATAGGSAGDLIDPSLTLTDDGHCSVRAHHTEASTVSSILPWLYDPDFIPTLSNVSLQDSE